MHALLRLGVAWLPALGITWPMLLFASCAGAIYYGAFSHDKAILSSMDCALDAALQYPVAEIQTPARLDTTPEHAVLPTSVPEDKALEKRTPSVATEMDSGRSPFPFGSIVLSLLACTL